MHRKMRQLALILVLIVIAGAVCGCRASEVLDAAGQSPSTQPPTAPSTLPSVPTLGSDPSTPSEPPAPEPVKYNLTGLWFWLDSSYQAGNSGESFANYHSEGIHVSVNWEPMPAGCADGAAYVQSFLDKQSHWEFTDSGEKSGIRYGICSNSQGRFLVLGVYPCGDMLGKIVAEGTAAAEQSLVAIVTSGYVVPEQVPVRNPNGMQTVEFGGLRLQISDTFAVTKEPDNVFCTDNSTAIMICYDSLKNYPGCTTAQEIAKKNAAYYTSMWETVKTDGSSIRMYDSDGSARILVYYLQGQTLWEVSASGTFTPEGLTQICQILTSAQIIVD